MAAQAPSSSSGDPEEPGQQASRRRGPAATGPSAETAWARRPRVPTRSSSTRALVHVTPTIPAEARTTARGRSRAGRPARGCPRAARTRRTSTTTFTSEASAVPSAIARKPSLRGSTSTNARFVATAAALASKRDPRPPERVERRRQHLHAGVGDEPDGEEQERRRRLVRVARREAAALEQQPHDRRAPARSGPRSRAPSGTRAAAARAPRPGACRPGPRPRPGARGPW